MLCETWRDGRWSSVGRVKTQQDHAAVVQRTTGRAALLATLTEKQWQAQVVEWARRAGWRVFHVYDMTRSAGGWPDLVLVKPGRSVMYVELKTVNGRLSPQQRAWLDDLKQAQGTCVQVWRPTDEATIKRFLFSNDSGQGAGLT